MSIFQGQFLKLRCEPCLGWGKASRYENGKQLITPCPDCEGRGWNETRLLVLKEKTKKTSSNQFFRI